MAFIPEWPRRGTLELLDLYRIADSHDISKVINAAIEDFIEDTRTDQERMSVLMQPQPRLRAEDV